jgi:hypothetical protein
VECVTRGARCVASNVDIELEVNRLYAASTIGKYNLIGCIHMYI